MSNTSNNSNSGSLQTFGNKQLTSINAKKEQFMHFIDSDGQSIKVMQEYERDGKTKIPVRGPSGSKREYNPKSIVFTFLGHLNDKWFDTLLFSEQEVTGKQLLAIESGYLADIRKRYPDREFVETLQVVDDTTEYALQQQFDDNNRLIRYRHGTFAVSVKDITTGKYKQVDKKVTFINLSAKYVPNPDVPSENYLSYLGVATQ